MGHIMRRTDAIVGVVTLAVGAYALHGALALSYFFNGAPGPGFFPRFLSIALILLGGAQLVRAFMPQPRPADSGEQEETSTTAHQARETPDQRGYLRVGGIAAGWIASAAIIDRIGFLIAMVLLVLYLGLVIDRKRGWRPIVLALVMPTAIYLAFSRLLQVQLPTGPLGF
jgi:putative tricarboxylic transport membrane protein